MIQNAQVKQNDDDGFRFGWDTMKNRIIFEPTQIIFVMYSNVLLQQDIKPRNKIDIVAIIIITC